MSNNQLNDEQCCSWEQREPGNFEELWHSQRLLRGKVEHGQQSLGVNPVSSNRPVSSGQQHSSLTTSRIWDHEAGGYEREGTASYMIEGACGIQRSSVTD